MDVLRLASLENGLAPLDPLNGGCGSQEDFLDREAAGGGVCYYSLQLALRGFIGATGWMQHLGRVQQIEQGTSFGMALAE